MTQRSFRRRSLLGAAFALPSIVPLAGCTDMATMFGQKPKYTLTPRGDRMVRWLQHEGRDIPVKQKAEGEPDDRYVISLVNIRKIHEFVLHHSDGNVLIFHNCDTKFARLVSVRYPRNGKPTFISDVAFAENDFQKQLGFWFERMPGR